MVFELVVVPDFIFNLVTIEIFDAKQPPHGRKGVPSAFLARRTLNGATPTAVAILARRTQNMSDENLENFCS